MEIKYKEKELATVRLNTDSLVIDINQGKFNYDETFSFHDQIKSILETKFASLENKLDIIIDMRKVIYMDSTCIGIFVRFHQYALARKGGIVLLNVNSTVKHLLDMTRLSELFRFISS
jgi:anti-anti-sigma factor